MARKSRKPASLPERLNIYQTALYLRLSDKELESEISESIRNQEELLRDYISAKSEFIVKGVFTDDGKSGTNFNRQGFQMMMEEVKKGIINCIIVKDLSRFGRNYLEAGNYIENIFPFMNVRFIAVNDNFDTLTSSMTEFGLMMPLKNMMNEHYAKDISKKERTVKATMRAKGLFLGTFPVYGYRKDQSDKHKLIIDEEAAEVVRLIFEKLEQGESDLKIAKYLNQANILPPAAYKYEKGDKKQVNSNPIWYKQTIARLSTNQTYIGSVVQGMRGSREMKGKKLVNPKEEWDVVENMHEPLITKEQFERVQKIRQIKKEAYTVVSENKQHVKNIFKGKIFCGHCGKAMGRHIANGCKDRYRFTCETYHSSGECSSHSIWEGRLKAVIEDSVNKRIALAKEIKERMDSKNKQDETALQLLALTEAEQQIQKELERLGNLKASLYRNLKEGVLEEDEYQYMKTSYSTQIEEGRNKAVAIENQKAELTDTIRRRTDAVAETVRYADKIIGVTELMAAFVEKIIIYASDRITISLKFEDELKEAAYFAFDNSW